jgi:hypothetical protein
MDIKAEAADGKQQLDQTWAKASPATRAAFVVTGAIVVAACVVFAIGGSRFWHWVASIFGAQ